jgi:hypothetical protein
VKINPSNVVMKSRWKSWAGHVASIGEKRKAYRALAGKPEEKKALARSRRR